MKNKNTMLFQMKKKNTMLYLIDNFNNQVIKNINY